jgi:hypothetical protein
MNQNVGLTGRARQFSRRLSYGITKALRDWQIGLINFYFYLKCIKTTINKVFIGNQFKSFQLFEQLFKVK